MGYFSLFSCKTKTKTNNVLYFKKQKLYFYFISHILYVYILKRFLQVMSFFRFRTLISFFQPTHPLSPIKISPDLALFRKAPQERMSLL